MSEHLAFAPEILRRLGEELVPHPDQGIVELVRNAYDADATSCVVELLQTNAPGGTVVVTDNGDGFGRSGIINGWLVLGRSSKRRTQRTQLGRVPAGDKGLGRLAALRLGKAATLRTRPAAEPGVEYEVTLEWAAYETADLIEDVPIEVIQRSTSEPPGTTITLSDLRAKFTRSSVTRLARSLVLLSDPFDTDESFRPTLVAPEFADLQARVQARYFDDIDYRVAAAVSSTGQASAEVVDWKGNVVYRATHEQIAVRRDGGAYETPPASLELWVFNLSGAGFSTKASTIQEVREWLQVVGGVHVYQHGLRVPPYGDSGADWLDMNLRRVRSPEARPSTNNTVGRVVIDDVGGDLVQKTDRTGFVENLAFLELKSFAVDVLEWVATETLQAAERRRRENRKLAEAKARSAKDDADTVQQSLAAAGDTAAEAAFQRHQRALERQLEAMQEDLLLYRTLGTVGTTTSAFAHESVKPAGRIEQSVRLAREAGKRAFGEEFSRKLGRHLDVIDKASVAIGRWAQLPLALLSRDKRRSQRLDLREAIGDVVDLLEPFMSEAKISLDVVVPERPVPLYGPAAAVESIIANLLVNSINAVVSDPGSRKKRRVLVTLRFPEGEFFATLSVADTGPGLKDIGPSEVWLPGRTTREQGTGLGLTIARDSTLDLGGSIEVNSPGPLGGAEFVVTFPVLEAAS